MRFPKRPAMLQTKKTWSKPEMIVLVRGRPEEAVLMACKFEGSSPTTSGQGWVACSVGCGDCRLVSAS